MKKEVDIEVELSRRMAGEVYPELLRLMKKTKTNSVEIKSKSTDSSTVYSNRFSISSEGVINDMASSEQDEMYGEDGGYTHYLEEYELMNNEEIVNDRTGLLGEAEDEGEECMSQTFDIKNITECPIYANAKNEDYVFYCEQVLEEVDRLMEKDNRIYEVIKKIDRIPFRKTVIIEKHKINEDR